MRRLLSMSQYCSEIGVLSLRLPWQVAPRQTRQDAGSGIAASVRSSATHMSGQTGLNLSTLNTRNTPYVCICASHLCSCLASLSSSCECDCHNARPRGVLYTARNTFEPHPPSLPGMQHSIALVAWLLLCIVNGGDLDLPLPTATMAQCCTPSYLA